MCCASQCWDPFAEAIVSYRVNNFSKDIKDAENYAVLLNQLKPEQCSRAPLQTRDLRQRAEQVSETVSHIHYTVLTRCRSYKMRTQLAVENT